ncbi:hypothetical protein DXA20_09505 [Roseburia sp. AM59-24XD]|nr:hypothetical protein DXA20_09505 [Roseburia sp. AM59-24XD]
MRLLDDVNVHVLDFGNSIPATVTINEDGSFSIFLNARLSYEQRMQAYLHEMQHIQKDDFFTHNTVEEKELHNTY